jgi:ribosomal-protein-alanine N-acetyltransferase
MPFFGETTFPILDTERLKLRQLSSKDTKKLFEIWSDKQVTQYMNISPLSTESQALEMIDLLNSLAERNEAIRWGIELKKTGELIGTCGFNSINHANARASIGYELEVAYWRQGYMSEVIHALLGYGFQQCHFNRIEATVEPENTPSMLLLEKLGFHREGLLRGYEYAKERYIDLYMFSILQNEYLLQNSQDTCL